MSTPANAQEVLDYWFGPPGPSAARMKGNMRRWYGGGPVIDEEIRQRFGPTVDRAIAGDLGEWEGEPRTALALILLLDQFPRSIYRDTARAYAGDARAQRLAVDVLARGWEKQLLPEERMFLLMPLLHAEKLDLQHRSVEEMDRLHADAPDDVKPILAMGQDQARKYLDIIERFGRFPHRNAFLDRTTTSPEMKFLEDWAEKMRPKDFDATVGKPPAEGSGTSGG